MRRILAVFLLAPVLSAQATATPTTQTLAQKVATETKKIEALKAEDPVEALEKAKALLPATKLTFDKASLQAAFLSIKEWNAHIDIYRLIYNTGMSAGHYEEAKEAAEKGRELAKELQIQATVPFNDFKSVWLKAGEASTRLLAEIKELEAKVEADRVAATNPKPKVTIEEANAEIMRQHEVSQRLAFLKANEAVYKQNIENSTKVMIPLERPIKDLEARTHEFDGSIEQWDKYLKEEAETMSTKYKGDKAKYAAGLLGGVAPKPEDKEAALVALHRAAFLDPKNPAIQKRIDQILGKVAIPAVKPVKAKAKAKKKAV
ncbi:MAG: hypothetical protein IPP78_15810 [Holophagaceae bacterium]|nr:hypothetical protein [Holophagaceae bacterium]